MTKKIQRLTANDWRETVLNDDLCWNRTGCLWLWFCCEGVGWGVVVGVLGGRSGILMGMRMRCIFMLLHLKEGLFCIRIMQISLLYTLFVIMELLFHVFVYCSSLLNIANRSYSICVEIGSLTSIDSSSTSISLPLSSLHSISPSSNSFTPFSTIKCNDSH